MPYHLQAIIPDDLHALIENERVRDGLPSISETVRRILTFHFYGQATTIGVDNGYVQARSMATSLAKACLFQALANLPRTYEEGVAYLEALRAEVQAKGDDL